MIIEDYLPRFVIDTLRAVLSLVGIGIDRRPPPRPSASYGSYARGRSRRWGNKGESGGGMLDRGAASFATVARASESLFESNEYAGLPDLEPPPDSDDDTDDDTDGGGDDDDGDDVARGEGTGGRRKRGGKAATRSKAGKAAVRLKMDETEEIEAAGLSVGVGRGEREGRPAGPTRTARTRNGSGGSSAPGGASAKSSRGPQGLQGSRAGGSVGRSASGNSAASGGRSRRSPSNPMAEPCDPRSAGQAARPPQGRSHHRHLRHSEVATGEDDDAFDDDDDDDDARDDERDDPWLYDQPPAHWAGAVPAPAPAIHGHCRNDGSGGGDGDARAETLALSNGSMRGTKRQGRGRMVYDPVYGLIPRETRDSWRAQEAETASSRARLNDCTQAPLPPVRSYTACR
jgi:hypothetical protein